VVRERGTSQTASSGMVAVIAIREMVVFVVSVSTVKVAIIPVVITSIAVAAVVILTLFFEYALSHI
jgi:hypothetical protein